MMNLLRYIAELWSIFWFNVTSFFVGVWIFLTDTVYVEEVPGVLAVEQPLVLDEFDVYEETEELDEL